MSQSILSCEGGVIGHLIPLRPRALVHICCFCCFCGGNGICPPLHDDLISGNRIARSIDQGNPQIQCINDFHPKCVLKSENVIFGLPISRYIFHLKRVNFGGEKTFWQPFPRKASFEVTDLSHPPK
jgi:hypothetical protein